MSKERLPRDPRPRPDVRPAITEPPGLVLDFDGTVTDRDIGADVVRRFAAPGWEEGLRQHMRNEWPIAGLQRWEAGLLPSDRLDEMEAFALEIGRLRPGLKELLDYAAGNGVSVEIASAGFEFYVTAILEHEGLQHLTALVPRLEPDGTPGKGAAFRLTYPPGAVTCERIGLCKCERLWQLQREGRRAFLVGDGMSDYCAAEQADLVFARASLARYCEERAIPYVGFEDFTDVLAEVRRQTTA